MWGLTPHENVKFWWGARAIFYPPAGIDLLPDRQQMTGGTEDERKKLSNWINNIGLYKLKEELAHKNVGAGSDILIAVDDKKAGFIMMANPRKSYGYLYISAMPYSTT